MPSRIVVLGSSDLRSEDASQIQSVLQQPRRFALLAYLALATRHGPVQRDTVLGVFWADKTQDKARGALNQAVHYLRRSLGADAIRTVGDTIELSRDQVTCDAVDFAEAHAAGRWKAAHDLYAGDLLPGFYDSGATPDFEQWLDGERRALHRLLRDAVCHLAADAEQAHATADAIVWTRRACAASGTEEAEIRKHMESMDRLGDRTGVVEAYDKLSGDLAALEMEPSPETTDLLGTLKQRWAADAPTPLAAQDAQEGRADPERAGGEAPIPASSGAGSAPTRRSAVSVAVLVLVPVLALAVYWGLQRPGPEAPAPAESAATVRVERMEAEEGEALPTGTLSDNIVSNLQAMTSLNVIDGTGAPPDRQVDATYVLRGGIVRDDGRIYVNIRLVDGMSGSTLASQRFERAAPEDMETLDALGRAIANYARRAIGLAREQQRIAESGAPPRAITLVQLGRSDLELGDSLRAAGVLDAARSAYDKADSVLAIAADIAPAWDQPWLERARIAQSRMWMDRGPPESWAEARRTAEVGIRYAEASLSRDDARVEAIEVLAGLHWWVWSLSQPDPQRKYDAELAAAERDARRATTLSPHRARSWNLLGAVLIQRGEWGDAYWALKRAIAADTYLENDLEIVIRLFTAAWETDNLDAARDWCSVLRDRVGTQWLTAYCELALEAVRAVPDTSRITRLAGEMSKAPDWGETEPAFDAVSAVLRSRAGDTASARALLERHPVTIDDSDLLYLQAWGWFDVGDSTTARRLLDRYVRWSPTAHNGVLRSRRFKGLDVRE